MSAQFPQYVVFGEALTDMLRQADGRWLAVPGGACWNVARVGARLGITTAFAGAVSHDIFGETLANASQLAGLDLRFLQRISASPLLAMVVSQHPPEYFLWVTIALICILMLAACQQVGGKRSRLCISVASA